LYYPALHILFLDRVGCPGYRILCFFDAGSGIRIRDGKKSGSGMNIADHFTRA